MKTVTKTAWGLLACAAVLLAGFAPARAAEAAQSPVFSTVVYLTEEQAASRVVYYCGADKEKALERVRASGEVKSNVNLLRSSPAYIFGQIDVGGGSLMELGAIGTVGRVDGRLRYLGIAGTYARPVNPNMQWTPAGAASAAVSGNTTLTMTASGTVSVQAQSVNDPMIGALLAAGFKEGKGARSYEKAVALSFSYPIQEGTFLTEADITDGYAAMLQTFQERERRPLEAFRSVALEVKTPVGLTASAKKGLFDWIADTCGQRPVESDYSAYLAEREAGRSLADCLFVIDHVSISGNTMEFDITGYIGGKPHALRGCKVEKLVNGWKAIDVKAVSYVS